MAVQINKDQAQQLIDIFGPYRVQREEGRGSSLQPAGFIPVLGRGGRGGVFFTDANSQRASDAVCIGGIAAVALAGASALFLRKFVNDCQAYRAFNEVEWDEGVLNEGEQNRFRNFLNDRRWFSGTVTFTSLSLLATAGAAFVGGMLSLQWLITASIIAAVAIGVIGMFSIVFQWSAPSHLTPVLENKMAQIQAQLQPEAHAV